MNIRLLNESDTQSLLDFESNNRSWFTKFIPDRPDKYFNIDTFSKVMEELIIEQQNGDCFLYLIIEDNKIIGRVNISEINGSSGEIGFRIGEESLGKGITTQAVKLLIDNAFNTHKLSILFAKTTSNNLASQSVIKKSGFIFTHEVKDAVVLNNETLDFYCYKLDIKI